MLHIRQSGIDNENVSSFCRADTCEQQHEALLAGCHLSRVINCYCYVQEFYSWQNMLHRELLEPLPRSFRTFNKLCLFYFFFAGATKKTRELLLLAFVCLDLIIPFSFSANQFCQQGNRLKSAMDVRKTVWFLMSLWEDTKV